MFKSKTKKIREIKAKPVSNEYNRMKEILSLYKNGTISDHERIKRDFVASENITELTFEEFRSSLIWGVHDHNSTGAKKLLKNQGWYVDDFQAWLDIAIHMGIGGMYKLFPYELWEGKNINLYLLFENIFLKHIFTPTEDTYDMVKLLSDKRYFQAYFNKAKNYPKFKLIFNANNFRKSKFRELFGSNFSEDTLEKVYEIDLNYYNKKADFISSLAGYERERVIDFFERNELSDTEAKELSETSPELFMQYVMINQAPDLYLGEFKSSFPDTAFVNDFKTVGTTLAFCRNHGIDKAFENISKLSLNHMKKSLLNLAKILIFQVGYETTPENWALVSKAISLDVYIELEKDKKTLKSLIDSGFIASETFIQNVEKRKQELYDAKVDWC